MNKLTDRQSEILEYVREFLRDNGAPPTRAGIAEQFGFASATAAENHLKALAAKGYIELLPGSARGIKLLGEAQEALRLPYELPLIGRIAAGTPLTAADNVEEHVLVDPALFRPKADFLHRVSGESMKEAGILDGDLVGIHEQSTADNGQIVAAVLPDRKTGDDRITLKRYFRRGNKVVLKAENSDPAYAPIEVDLAKPGADDGEQPAFRIAGLYSGLIRSAR